MPTHPAFLAFFLLAGCATLTARPEGLVDNPVYSAGGPPGWQLEIGTTSCFGSVTRFSAAT